MSPKKPPDSTRARKARSIKLTPTPRRKPTLSPAAMKKRLATRKRATGLGTAAVDALREIRDGIPEGAPSSARAPRARRRKPTRADKWASEALFNLLDDVTNVRALLTVTARSFEQQEGFGDEHAALEMAIKLLRAVDLKLNGIADKVDESEPVTRADLIRAGAFDDEDEDTTDDDGGAP
jgi:hypothetical protein